MTRIRAIVKTLMAGADTEIAGAEIALQEFIDRLQVLILLLPPVATRSDEAANEPLDSATLSATLRLLSSATDLRRQLLDLAGRSEALRRNPV